VKEKSSMLREHYTHRMIIASQIKLLVIGQERVGNRLADRFLSIVPRSTTQVTSKQLSEKIHDIHVIFEEFNQRYPDGLSRTSNDMTHLLLLMDDAVALTRNSVLDKK